MSSTVIMALCLAAMVVVYLVARFVFKINLMAFLNGGIMDIFKIAAVGSAVFEIMALSSMAITRGVDPIVAISRYSMLSATEAITGLWFTTAFVSTLQAKMDDYTLTVWELMKTILGVSWIFMASYFFTNQLYLLYLESIGRIEVQQVAVNMLNAFKDIVYETDVDSFEFEPDKEPIKIEMGAVVSIYISVFFNIIIIPYYLYQNWNSLFFIHPLSLFGRKWYSTFETLYGKNWVHEMETIYKNKGLEIPGSSLKKPASGSGSGSGTANAAVTSPYFDTVKNSGKAFEDYSGFLKSMFKIDATEWKNFIFEYCGRNFETSTAVAGSATNSAVKNNTMTPDEALAKITKDLIENKSYGFAELFKRATDLSNELISTKTMLDKLTKSGDNIDATTDPATRVTLVKDWEKEHNVYKTHVTKVEGLHSKFKSAHGPLLNSIKTLNYPGTIDGNINPFTNVITSLKAYVNTSK